MIDPNKRLSLGALLRTYWLRVTFTWLLTLVETALFALMPLLIGRAIDGLLADGWLRFNQLIALFGTLIVVAVGRRIYDTRAYGGIRVHLGNAQASRSVDDKVSVVNARVLMGRELVDFMEDTAPESMTALVQVIASIVVLVSFHGNLALAADGALVFMLAVYGLASPRFYKLNGALNAASENQVHALESKSPKAIAAHFLVLKKQEVKLSDTEALVVRFNLRGLTQHACSQPLVCGNSTHRHTRSDLLRRDLLLRVPAIGCDATVGVAITHPTERNHQPNQWQPQCTRLG